MTDPVLVSIFDEIRRRFSRLESQVAELNKFQDFAQPIVINASRLWDKTHEREGLKDYFKPIQIEAPPLVKLGEALDRITPVEPTPEIGESKPTMEGAG